MRTRVRTTLALVAVTGLVGACDDDGADVGSASTTDRPSAPTAPALAPTVSATAPAPAGDTPAVTAASVEAALGEIDGLVAAEMDHFGVPGVAEVVHLASLSKPITATAVAGLVDDGVIAWDDPVHEHNPDLTFSDDYVTEHVTFADLYSHRSGLPGLFGNTLEHIGDSRDEILSKLHLLPLDPFRSSYSYSNFGMTAAGDAAAKAAGTSFDDLVDEQLFQPAGMTSSSTRHADFAAEANRSAIHVTDGDMWRVGPERRPDAQAPAGGVSASLEDVTRWTRLVLNGGALDGEQIIGQDALADTHVPHVVRGPSAGYDGPTPFYGLGWNIDEDHLGFRRWSHSGAFSAGAATTAVLLPTEGLGVVVLTNGMPLGIPEIIADEIVDQIATGGLTDDWREVWYTDRFAHLFDAPELEIPATPTPAAAATAYVGTYANDYFGEFEVVADGDDLTLVEHDNRYPMTHLDGDTFTITAYPELADGSEPVTFTLGPDGTVTALDVGEADGPGTGVLTRVP